MQAVARFLKGLKFVETLICFLAFCVMAGALIFDVLKREFTGSGALGAPQVGVIGMIVVSYIGIALASANGSHFRPRFADPLIPKKFEPAVDRFAEFGFAAFCFWMTYVATLVALESKDLGDVSAVLRWPIWPVQMVIAAGFGLVGLRHTLYGIFLELKPMPPEKVEGIEIATDKEQDDILHSGDKAQEAKP